ncbi:hypothetical protein K1W54_06860 [Micromonospora sp. CPCC 205371]|nr:hypothetical protein [Micromonospora sp. CPCC 205371]
MRIHLDSTGPAAHGRLRPDTSAAITTILLNTEATADRCGWDQQPVLFGLFEHVRADGTATVEVDPSITEPDLWTTPDPRRHGLPLPVPVILHRFATDLTTPAARRWLDSWLHVNGRTCVGIGLAFEAWAGPIRPGYRYGDLAKPPTGQRREVRIVAAVDTDLRLHRIIRVRGADTPLLDRWAHLPARSRHRSIVTGLHRLARIARSH